MKTLQSIYDSRLLRSELIERRLYQENIAQTCINHDTLVILPTGLGKTLIAVLIAARILEENPESQILIMAPTKPLVEQHARVFSDLLKIDWKKIVVMTGEVLPEKRSKMWRNAVIISATPQVVQNDVIAGRCDVRRLSLVVFDEAHRALGDYPYVFIAKYIRSRNPKARLVGLTASPGSTKEQILEVMNNLIINRIEARSERDPDVLPYVKPVDIEWLTCEMTPIMQKARTLILNMMNELREKLLSLGITLPPASELKKRELLELKTKVIEHENELGENIKLVYAIVNNLIRLEHMLELLEIQGIKPLREFIVNIETLASRSGATGAIKMLVKNRNWMELSNLVKLPGNEEHPKVNLLKNLLKEIYTSNPNVRGIVFTTIRSGVKMILDAISDILNIKAERFVGQADKLDKGMSQKEQIRVLEEFKNGEINLLIATNVGEEGLDVSECNFVIFYDNPPSAIRIVQRMGRTGRKFPGRVYVLLTKGTRDERYYWAGLQRKRTMRTLIRELSNNKNVIMGKIEQTNIEKTKTTSQELIRATQPQTTIQSKVSLQTQSQEEQLTIYVDNRELQSDIAKELILRGVDVRPVNLEIGDYVLSDEVVVERKTAEDFAKSIIDKRIFNQIINMRDAYSKPVLLIEGSTLYAPIINAEAVRGAIASIIVDFGVPVINVKDANEAASLFISIAKREQMEKRKQPTIKSGKRPITLKEQQETVVASLPNIDLTLAKRLLKRFRSVINVFNASKEELMKVEGIGEKISNKIREVLDSEYKNED
ncbi:MAG: DEAD/DEAH box helicase [Thermoprotei archaeon]